MRTKFKLDLLAVSIGALLLAGCGDAEINIVEKDPIVVPGDDDHDHGDGDGYLIESMGRMAVLSAESPVVNIVDIDDGSVLDSFALTHTSNTIKASADYRYLIVASRSNDYVGFIDGGLWREDHGAHLHDYKQAPAESNFELAGNVPTHLVTHDGQLAVFFDGDADAGTPASVQVISDTDISSETADIATLTYTVNMHGVAEPRGDHLFSTIRRDDAESTSNAKVLPDQVGVYHLHDGEYELETTLAMTCPDLHGAAQNHEFVAFGCSDGVMLVHEHDGEFEAEKIANIAELNGMRVGTIYGHEDAEAFIGIASAHGGGAAVLVAINGEENEMEALEWQPAAGESPVAYAFTQGAEHFLILDSAGFLNVLMPHEHDGHTHWELEERVDITEEDVSTMPEGSKFTMAVAQNGHYVYVTDPIAKHVLQIDLDDFSIEGDTELDFIPASVVWLGIAEEGEEHDHAH